ncbi:hypothetical protein LX36DRAFT_54474 [Colletotrichum falcatum]|nr:hypothetical protein LX36DRAFT_54474 [Colletotrichum falcatum]
MSLQPVAAKRIAYSSCLMFEETNAFLHLSTTAMPRAMFENGRLQLCRRHFDFDIHIAFPSERAFLFRASPTLRLFWPHIHPFECLIGLVSFLPFHGDQNTLRHGTKILPRTAQLYMATSTVSLSSGNRCLLGSPSSTPLGLTDNVFVEALLRYAFVVVESWGAADFTVGVRPLDAGIQ